VTEDFANHDQDVVAPEFKVIKMIMFEGTGGQGPIADEAATPNDIGNYVGAKVHLP